MERKKKTRDVLSKTAAPRPGARTRIPDLRTCQRRARGHLPGRSARSLGAAGWAAGAPRPGRVARAASPRPPCSPAQSGLSNYFLLLVAPPGRGSSKPGKGIYLSWDMGWHACPQPVAEKLPALQRYPASRRRRWLFCKLAWSLLLQLQRLRLHKVL